MPGNFIVNSVTKTAGKTAAAASNVSAAATNKYEAVIEEYKRLVSGTDDFTQAVKEYNKSFKSLNAALKNVSLTSDWKGKVTKLRNIGQFAEELVGVSKSINSSMNKLGKAKKGGPAFSNAFADLGIALQKGSNILSKDSPKYINVISKSFKKLMEDSAGALLNNAKYISDIRNRRLSRKTSILEPFREAEGQARSGQTSYLAKPVAKIIGQGVGKITQALMDQAKTEALLRPSGITRHLSKRERNAIESGIITPPPLPPPPPPGRPTAHFNWSGGWGTRPLVPTAIFGGKHPAGMLKWPSSLPPVGPSRPTTPFRGGGGRGAATSAIGGGAATTSLGGAAVGGAGGLLIGAAEIYEGIKFAGSLIKHIKTGADYDLGVARDLGMLTTNAPVFALSGRGTRGIHGPFRDPMGKVTLEEANRLPINRPDVAGMLGMAGVPRWKWPEVMASYGVRGGLPEALNLASSMSMDADLWYKNAEQWAATLGKVTRMRNTGPRGLYKFSEVLRGGMQGAEIKNIAKPDFENMVMSGIAELGQRGNIGSRSGSDMAAYIGSVIGGTNLPELRQNGGVPALAQVQSAFGGVTTNPYLYTILGQMYADANKSTKGTKKGWEKAIGSLGEYGAVASSMEANNLPLSYQIGILGRQYAMAPNLALPMLTKYFKKRFGKNAAMGMTMEESVLAAGGQVTPEMAALLFHEWFETPGNVKPTKLKGAIPTLHRPGDIARLKVAKAMEKPSVMINATAASDLSKEMMNLAHIETLLTNKFDRLLDDFDILMNWMGGWLGAPPRYGTTKTSYSVPPTRWPMSPSKPRAS